MELAAQAPSGIRAPIAVSKRPRSPRRNTPMVVKLAYRNLFHDRLSFVVTVVGILFSVVLVAVMSGIHQGSKNNIATIIDAAPADLWVVPLGTKSLDDPSLLSGRERFLALSAPGVANSEDMVVAFARWRKPEGGETTVLLIGTPPDSSQALPKNVVEGSLEALDAPGRVAVDQSYFKDLGITRVGDVGEVNGSTVKLVAATRRVRSFTTLPFIFTSIDETKRLDPRISQNQSTYQRVTLLPNANIEDVRKEIERRLPDTEVLTQKEFAERSQNYWLNETGAGAALDACRLLGLIVGIVIVAQTLYSSTKDHINEFATLRALGAGASYIVKVILIQAVLSGLIGFVFGFSLALLIMWAELDPKLTITITPQLGLQLFFITIGMCIFAAISAIIKVVRIDPAVVFSR